MKLMMMIYHFHIWKEAWTADITDGFSKNFLASQSKLVRSSPSRPGLARPIASNQIKNIIKKKCHQNGEYPVIAGIAPFKISKTIQTKSKHKSKHQQQSYPAASKARNFERNVHISYLKILQKYLFVY